jgi:hypothetical protein
MVLDVSPIHTYTMAERLREVAEIPQQFIKEGTLVGPLSNAQIIELMNSSLIDVRNLLKMVSPFPYEQ